MASSFFSKIKYLFKKPKVVLVAGRGRECAREAIFQVLSDYFKVGSEIIVIEVGPDNKTKIKKVLKRASLAVLVVTNFGQIPLDKDFFAGEKKEVKDILQLAKNLSIQSWLVLNFDDETVREIDDETNLNTLTFGFQEGADFAASDIHLNSGTNFKINYKGNIIPCWLKGIFGKEQVYSALSAACVATIFDLNLVEVSQSLKKYRSLPGKMRLVEWKKGIELLDNSKGDNIFSLVEALDVLAGLEGFKRKIAVLGQVQGIEKYIPKAYQSIGERAAEKADLLFLFGPEAKFIAQGAARKGFDLEKIKQYDIIEQLKKDLEKETKKGDIILLNAPLAL